MTVTNIIFCPPPLGKPNPLENRPLVGKDTRGRVIQKGLKDNTCWYSLLNFFRERYKAPNTEGLEQRKFEKIASSRRKMVSQAYGSLPDIIDQMNAPELKKNFELVTPSRVKDGMFQEFFSRSDEEATIKLKPFLDDFIQQDQYTNLYDFLYGLKLKKLEQANRPFFDSLNINMDELLDINRAKDPVAYHFITKGKNWNDFPVTTKGLLFDHFARLISCEKYGIKISTWHPKAPFQKLMEELKTNGPLGVFGCFGTPHYIPEPRTMGKTIEGREVFYWSKNDARREGLISAHAILIVGAEKNATGEFVYYIDTKDDSDPAHPEKQRIFLMSYNRLIDEKSIADLLCILRNNAPMEIGYALYRPKE